MQNLTDKYINPFTDFGFKKLFGEEPNKDLLIDFLNQLLPEENTIADLTYFRNEQLGSTDTDRKAIFDLYCENEKGEKFIVELQKAKQDFFKDRSVFYSTFPIREQAKRGEWNFKLNAVYTIGVLDFVFEEADGEEKKKFMHQIKLTDIETCKVFYDKLTYIYLEMPKFIKTEAELKTRFDKWMYVIRHLPEFQNRPKALQEKVFQKLFKVAEIAKFNSEEVKAYENSLKYYRDLKNVIDTAREEGKSEGMAEGERRKALQTAQKMLQKGYSVEEVAELTGLSIKEMEKLSTL